MQMKTGWVNIVIYVCAYFSDTLASVSLLPWYERTEPCRRLNARLRAGSSAGFDPRDQTENTHMSQMHVILTELLTMWRNISKLGEDVAPPPRFRQTLVVTGRLITFSVNPWLSKYYVVCFFMADVDGAFDEMCCFNRGLCFSARCQWENITSTSAD